MWPSSWQRTAACCHSGRFSLMAIVLRRSVRFQKPFTVGGRSTKYTMQFSSFARRYGSDVSYRFTRFLTRRGMFIGFTSFTAVIINNKKASAEAEAFLRYTVTFLVLFGSQAQSVITYYMFLGKLSRLSASM